MLERILGRYTIIDENKKEKGTRELMTPDEIRMCEDAIVLINNQAPLRCKTVPVYKNIWLNRHTTLPPYRLSPKTVSEPPLIQFG